MHSLLTQFCVTIVIKIAKSLPPVWSKHAHMGFFGTFTGEQRINIKLEAEVKYKNTEIYTKHSAALILIRMINMFILHIA